MDSALDARDGVIKRSWCSYDNKLVHIIHLLFQKMVSKGEDQEQNLYAKVRNAEYSRQQQEQNVRRIQQQLQELKRKNAALVKKELAAVNKQEQELEQQLTREKAELDRVGLIDLNKYLHHLEHYLMNEKAGLGKVGLADISIYKQELKECFIRKWTYVVCRVGITHINKSKHEFEEFTREMLKLRKVGNTNVNRCKQGIVLKIKENAEVGLTCRN